MGPVRSAAMITRFLSVLPRKLADHFLTDWFDSQCRIRLGSVTWIWTGSVTLFVPTDRYIARVDHGGPKEQSDECFILNRTTPRAYAASRRWSTRQRRVDSNENSGRASFFQDPAVAVRSSKSRCIAWCTPHYGKGDYIE
jgi:hypothetical protein